jgi:hypothetical protein
MFIETELTIDEHRLYEAANGAGLILVSKE